MSGSFEKKAIELTDFLEQYNKYITSHVSPEEMKEKGITILVKPNALDKIISSLKEDDTFKKDIKLRKSIFKYKDENQIKEEIAKHKIDTTLIRIDSTLCNQYNMTKQNEAYNLKIEGYTIKIRVETSK